MFVGGNRPKSRFSLILLDEGEYYFDDYSAFYYPPAKDEEESLRKKVKGRVLVCSSSLMFDPDDIRVPVIKIPFREMAAVEPWTGPLTVSAGKADIFVVRANLVVEMKENNADSPYKFKRQAGLEYRFSLSYVALSPVLASVSSLLRISRYPRGEAEVMIRSIIEEREKTTQFDHSWLVDLNERPLLEIIGARVSPLVVNPGRVLVTNSMLYFQPMNNIEATPVNFYKLESIVRVARRRHGLRETGIEIFLDDDSSLFYTFPRPKERNSLFDLLTKDVASAKLQANDQNNMTLKWQNGIISNYDYIVYLNNAAGRTFNDLTQYPVFPWVVKDYTSKTLDLTKPESFRDLTKPIGALNPQRLSTFRARYEQIPEGQPKFLFGTHYSTPAYVLYYLVRQAPEYMLRLQNGKFDAADRMFHSIEDTWSSVLNNPTDVKELIPEFYQPSKSNFLLNTEHLELGAKQNGTRLGDIMLPPWADDPADFITKLRAALECDYVSERLHHWIDLIFGYKQQGDEAVKANNLFYHLTYEGAVDMDLITDPVERASLEAQINEFGQTPKKLFDVPHPQRLPQNLQKQLTDLTLLPTSSPTSSSNENISQSGGGGGASSENSNTSNAPFVPVTWGNMDKIRLDFPVKLHRDAVNAVCLSNDQNTLFSVSQDTSLKIYSLTERRQLRSVNICGLALSSCELTHDEKCIIIGSWDNNIYLYGVEFGRVRETVAAHDDAVSCLKLHGETLLSGSWDSSTKLWKLRPTGVGKVPLAEFIDSETPIRCVDIDPRGNMSVSGSEDGSISFSDLRSNRHVRTVQPHIDAVTRIRFTPDGDRVVTCSEDGHIKVMEMRGAEICSIDAEESLKSLDTDGKTLFVGGDSGVVRVFDLASAAEERTIDAHSEPLNYIGVAAGGDVMLTGGGGGSIGFWSRKPLY